ncbi:SDR family oxidoreductase [Chitinophaga sp.]|uniref:NAD(P)-dependent oxidoreductase n=1 Tax=Chitinophaga sp. TaxID=1869181 RepID=UPI0031E2BC44
MKIAVIGATRGIGLELVKIALAEGHEVTILARDPDRMPIADNHLRIIQGNALDWKAVFKVVEGQDVVCSCLGTTDVMKKITMFSRCAENLSRTLKAEQLLIAVTGLGAGDSKGHCGILYDRFFLPVVLKRIYADKDIEESIIQNQLNRWIIVRPGFLNNGPRTGCYRALIDLNGIHGGRISRSDVADFILNQAKSPQFIGQTPMLIY